MNKLITFLPIILFFIILVYFGFYFRRKNKNLNFLNEYFLAERNLNFFVLALLVASSYISASSFISGPAAVYKYGISFLIIAVIQIPTSLITFLIIGEKINTEAKKINAFNVVDYISFRYGSSCLTLLSSLIIILFSLVLISAQVIGGAKLLEFVLGINYSLALLMFSFIIFFYVHFGGIKAVAYTDIIQGSLMIFSSLFLFFKLSYLGGGINSIFKKALNSEVPYLSSLNPSISFNYILSFWIIIGVGTLGLPNLINNFILFKDSKSIRNALPLTMFVIGFLIILMHLIGFFSLILYPNLNANDKVILHIASSVLSPFIFGIFITGLLSSIMSTVDANLLFISSILVKMTPFKTKNNKSNIFLVNIFFAIVVGLISLQPPDLLLSLNLFAFGALEVSFFPIFVFGLYLKFASKFSAIISLFFGLSSYLLIIFLNIDFYSFHPVVPSFFISIVSFLVTNFICKKYDII